MHPSSSEADARHECEQKRHGIGEKSECEKPPAVSFHALHVHLKRREEHDIVESHLAEKLEGVVACQDVEPVLSHCHAGEHHAYDVRNAQLAHDYRRKEDNQQYHKENECGVGYRKVTGYFGHEYIFMCKVTQKNG